VAPLAICRTVLHAGANEIIVRDRIPAPVSEAGAPPSDPLCYNDEDAMNLLRGSSNPPHCPHDLWFVLDLDGNGRHGDLAAWKHYDRFTLRVSWPASVSPLTISLLLNKKKKKYPVQVSLKLHRPIVSSATAPSSSARTDTMARRRLHLAQIRLKQEGIPVPGTRQREHREEGVPLVVLLEPLVLGVLPASVLPTVVTLLVLLGVMACSVLPYVLSVLGEVVEKARRELVLLGERKGKERTD
jgi:hypothetical protein